MPRLRHNTLKLPRSNIFERPLEMSLWPLKIWIWFVFVGLQIRVYEFDKAIQVLDRNGFVLLVKVIDIAIKDFDKQFHGYGRIHAGIRNTKGALETF